jgi:hypothetical protein
MLSTTRVATPQPDACATAPAAPATGAARERLAGPVAARRLANTFFKLAYRWTHTRAYRHNERLRHGVSIERDERGFLLGMTLDGCPLPLANGGGMPRRGPGACHLIATGASVNEIDYAALEPHNVIGVNGAVALQDQQPVRFDYYCMVDIGFVRNRPDLVARAIAQDLLLFTTPIVLWHILQRFALERLRCRVFLIEDVLFPARLRAVTMHELFAGPRTAGLVLFDKARALGFSLDARRGIFDSRTVAYTALQIAAWIGFKSIYLHGVDLCDASRSPRFYETQAGMQPTALDEHFARYIEPSFRHAAGLLRSRGVEVINLSSRSALGDDVFAKLDWRALCQPLVA